MPSNLDTLRRIHALALRSSILGPVDEDLSVEAGMDGNLARLLQAARILDREATNHPPGSMLSGDREPGRWFDFSLGFSCEGPDLDTVNAVLGLRSGWVIRVEYASEDGLDRLIDDVVFSGLEQGDHDLDFPVFLVGHRYDDAHEADNDYRGEPVRVPLAGARITVY
jgi:hypothetical protein